MPDCEALSQEIQTLRGHFGGEVIYLNPNQYSPVYVPRLLFGFQYLKRLRALEASLDMHHLYNPDPFPFPILRTLRRPVIYSLSGGVEDRRLNVPFFASMDAVTVADVDSLGRLKSQGLDNVMLVRPGIDTTRFTHIPLSLGPEITLMVGSAPWTRTQFRTKGVDALLEVAQRCSWLHLVFLWRGVLIEEMRHRVHRLGLKEQVEVINRRTDVNEVLAGVHASVALATGPAIIRSYPHSLMESLAAGKPVIVSRQIPMADYVQRMGCGTVVESVTPVDLLAAIKSLARDYEKLQQAARRVGQRDFSQHQMVASYQRVYERVLESTGRL